MQPVTALEGNFLAVGMTLWLAVFLLVALVMTILWILALVDALRIPDATWQRAGQSKLLWVLVVVLLHLLGALLYAVMARPALGRARPTP
jgi:hypothetical protein